MSNFIDLYLSPELRIYLHRCHLDYLLDFDFKAEEDIKNILSIDINKAQALLCLHLVEVSIKQLEEDEDSEEDDIVTAIFMSTFITEIVEYLKAKYPENPIKTEGGVLWVGVRKRKNKRS